VNARSSQPFCPDTPIRISPKDIAVKLSISDQTVKNHLTSIFDKMRVSSRLELVLCATKNKLFDEVV